LNAVFRAKWNNFKAAHGKAYHHREEQHRLNAFLRNTLHVEQHNERFAMGLESYELGHNEWSDMTHEEFKDRVLMKISREPPTNVSSIQLEHTVALPDSVDWRGCTPTVKNQGSCGSCYTFGAIGALEGAYHRKFGRNVVLSEQHLLDCTHKYGNSGCNGGLEGPCFNFARDNGGVHADSDMKYQGSVGTCRALGGTKYAKTTTYAHVGDQASITKALATVGPMAAGISAGSRSFYLYKGGVFDDAACDGNIDHSVVLIGYGVANGKQFYTIKNSWGSSWGEGGFMRLARNRCKIDRDGIYPTLA